ncbi:flagellar basal body rod protein [Radiobacillus kanasensis]|uniref:lmo0954 family membrane protein n=1 Tax=Radiobacillus kanasensis TaxID=2844358 RepID=UPI001E3FB301|nr:flagellar basal body rod protein [Radiobacillus kanasensis]UFT98626.1 flagellar basal body rod protein [Radiobacillus kanasensis]
MKTFLLALLAIAAAVLIVSNIGPMILLAVSLVVSYYSIKKFVLANSVTEKILWGFVILIGISLSLANIPAFIGVVAFVVLYYTYKKWKKDKEEKLFTKDEILF